MVQVGRHRIGACVFGEGSPVVVIEPAFGGRAEAWRPIAEAVAADTKVVTYDRAPYGASSPAADGRTPTDVAHDLHGVLQALKISDPLVLVGHSLGGVYARMYAAMFGDRVAGMVLIDSSSEGQHSLLRKHYPPTVRVISALSIPLIMFSTRKQRGGGDRRSLIRENRAFGRLTAADRALGPSEFGDKPLIVLTRGSRKPSRDALWEAWHGLHRELARLSSDSRHIVSGSHRHYLNKSDPGLVIAAIRQVVMSVRTRVPLRELAARDSHDGGE